MRFRGVVALASCAIMLFCGSARAEKRVALVVGNDRYTNLPAEMQLQKAANDAQAVGDQLAKLGFIVVRGQNLGRQAMIDKIAEFTAQIEPGDTAALFYAGHGVAIGGTNYLVMSDVPSVTPDAELRVRGASVAEGDIVSEIQSKGARVALLVLDACRDNPFPHTGTRSIGNTRGLSDAKPARGVFTIYSAGIGQTALDRLEKNDPNPNSVFTRVFVRSLAAQNTSLGEMVVDMREKVADLALTAKNDLGQPEPHEQTPAYYDQTIGGRVYLASRPPATATPPANTPGLQVGRTDPSDPLRLDLVTDCDLLASSPYDPQRPRNLAGVFPSKIDYVPALAACNAAMTQYPDVARFYYQTGRIAEAKNDYATAHRLYEKAASMGNPAAMNNLGNLYGNGQDVAVDHVTESKWYEKAAAGGVIVAAINLGVLHDTGQGVTQDYAEAKRLYESAAEKGSTGSEFAMDRLGLLYDHGHGVAQDYAEARKWYEKAAALGNADAMSRLGNLYNQGNGVARDYAEARRWFEKAAASSDAYSMRELGIFYDDGNGVARDYVEARKWYNKAAEIGDAGSMARLGYLYEAGNGVTKDQGEARKWYEKAAALGDDYSMNRLGDIYQNGVGVTQDVSIATDWYKRAAVAGNENAKKHLADQQAADKIGSRKRSSRR